MCLEVWLDNGQCDLLGARAHLYWLAYDGANVIATMMSGTTNQNETWRFVHGPGLDNPLYGVLKKFDGTYREYLYVTDGNGRQFVVAPENGQMGAFYPDITDWGGSLAGATGKSFSFDANRHTISAGGTVSSFRNRLYDQATGRWAQEDPIGLAGGSNLYQFNGNNPSMFSDPFGLRPCSDIRKDMQRQYKDYMSDFRRYHSFHADGMSTPGHQKELENRQRGLKNLDDEYKEEECDKDDDHDNFSQQYQKITHFASVPIPQAKIPKLQMETMPGTRNCGGQGLRVVAGIIATALLLDNISGIGVLDDPAAAFFGAVALCP